VNGLLVKDDDLGRINRVAGQSGVGILNKELEEKGIILGARLVKVAIPREGEIDLTAIARKGGQVEIDRISAGLIGQGIHVGPVSDGPEKAVADLAAAGEFEGDAHRVVRLNSRIDGFQGDCWLTGIVLIAAHYHQRNYDQCYQYSGYQKGTELHETDLIPANYLILSKRA
jgi:hypothetical protein